MELSRTQKILLGITTLLPFLLVANILYSVIQYIAFAVNEGIADVESATAVSAVFSFVGQIILVSLLTFFLLLLYIIHAVRHPRFGSLERIIWILLFLLGTVIIFPVYWFMWVWKNDTVPPQPLPVD